MERNFNNELLKWKRESEHKPFILYGARQVGKTYLALEFGKKYYQTIAYFNTLNNLELKNLLNKEKAVDKLILKLSIILGENILKKDTLIIFDNCSDIELINDLKVFNNDKCDNDIIIITSKKALLNKIKSDNFYFRQLNNLDFEEYLLNSDKSQLVDFIMDSYETAKPMPFHQIAIDMYNDYLITGGFPETVNAKLNGESDLIVEAIKQKILDIYNGEASDIDRDSYVRSNEIMNNLGSQLSKGCKKFQYSSIKKGGRSKEYDSSIKLLVTNGILNRSYKVSDIESPLSKVRDVESFKLYYNDSGLLYTMMNLNRMKFMINDKVRRVLIENNLANVLINFGYAIHYYQSDGKAEVNFVVQNRKGKIIPIEIVDTSLTKAKSLSLLLHKYNLTEAIRISEENFQKKKGIKYIPVYAMFCLKEI